MNFIAKSKMFLLRCYMEGLLKDVTPLVSFPLKVWLELNQWSKYEDMAASQSFASLAAEMVKDIQSWTEKLRYSFSPEGLEEKERNTKLYYQRLSERRGTPQALVAAVLHIPWSRLKQLKRGIQDTETLDVFIVKDRVIFHHVHATGENFQHVVDLMDDIYGGDEFIAELPQPVMSRTLFGDINV